jgi:hypothetical protein
MTPRERQASGGAALAPRPATALPRPGPHGPEDRPVPPWEDLFRGLPAAQQAELLDLAARQGLLYSRQLPPADAAALASRRQLLPQLLAGKADLAPLAARPAPPWPSPPAAGRDGGEGPDFACPAPRHV